MQNVEEKAKLTKWSSDQKPIYDIEKTYLENFQMGPNFKGSIPERPKIDKSFWHDFLGHKLQSSLGVPAGPLLPASWIKLAAELGFDTLTYKTIRSKKHACHPLPNMLYVDVKRNQDMLLEAIQRDCMQDSLEEIAVTNSFGMPSMEKDFLLKDIESANNSLSEGQIMVVSVVGTPSPGCDFFQDFVEAASLAKDAGAKIIEANFSCPNVISKEGTIYTDPGAVYKLGSMIKTAIGDTPLIIKVGYIEDELQIKELAIAANRAKIDAISAINTVSMEVKTEKGLPALGNNRRRSGICGGPIKPFGLDFTKKLSSVINKEELNLQLIGVGGITLSEHFHEYFNAGAHFAQSATGMMWDPFLAMRYHYRGE